MIRDSFKACGLTNNLDQSEDDQILVFKEGKCCAGKLDDFSKMMQDRIADVKDKFNVPGKIVAEDGAPKEENLNDDVIVDVMRHNHSH